MARSSPYWDLLGGPRRVIPEHRKVRRWAPNICALGDLPAPPIVETWSVLGGPLWGSLLSVSYFTLLKKDLSTLVKTLTI